MDALKRALSGALIFCKSPRQAFVKPSIKPSVKPSFSIGALSYFLNLGSAFVNSYGALSERFRGAFRGLSKRFQSAFGDFRERLREHFRERFTRTKLLKCKRSKRS